MGQMSTDVDLQKLKWDLLAGITKPPGWYHSALTMIGPKRMDTLKRLAEQVLANNVPGDFCETGVWRGGACIFMRGILKARGITDRKVWVCDSFEGVPSPDPEHYPSDAGNKLYDFPILAISLEKVRANFEKMGLLDDQVVFIQGWFRDTMPTLPAERLALLRLDGDLYESTLQVLDALYPKLSPGGAIIIDDYGDLACCRQAVDDYRKSHHITEPITFTDKSEVYWIKGAYTVQESPMSAIVIIIPTWNNLELLMRTVQSCLTYTWGVQIRFVIIDNGSTDETPQFLISLKNAGVDITIITNEQNVGFVKATNQGLREAKPGEIICLANDDIQIVDPCTFGRMARDLEEDSSVGMVVPTSDYVMHLQKSELSTQIPKTKHETGVVVYFCGMWRYDVFERVGFLDERFGIGGNDDLDLSIRIKEMGYKLLIDRNVFVRHFGSATLARTQGNIEGIRKLDEEKRKILVEKWGQAKVDALFRPPDFLLYGQAYFENISDYRRRPAWLNEWKRVADKIVETLHPTSVLDAGCAHGMLVEALVDILGTKFIANGVDVSEYALSQAREDIKPLLALYSIVDFDKALDSVDLPPRYDLICCIEVMEHLTESDGKKAVKNLCNHAKRILFSSTPTDVTEPTHQTVRPQEYWIGLFKDNGFVPNVSYDASWLTAWAILFVKE
jgi:GT2 family glycosyltransferase